MAADIAKIVGQAVAGLGYELVDFERATSGLLRVFIDKPDGIGVEDCAAVSNHLTRLFTVEEVDFTRLEVSSPGLDRPLKTLADFQRFVGCEVKVRLFEAVETRKRFEAVVAKVEGDVIHFNLREESGAPTRRVKRALAAGNVAAGAAVSLAVSLANIDRARLIPDF